MSTQPTLSGAKDIEALQKLREVLQLWNNNLKSKGKKDIQVLPKEDNKKALVLWSKSVGRSATTRTNKRIHVTKILEEAT